MQQVLAQCNGCADPFGRLLRAVKNKGRLKRQNRRWPAENQGCPAQAISQVKGHMEHSSDLPLYIFSFFKVE
jgi:hypothetical protein